MLILWERKPGCWARRRALFERVAKRSMVPGYVQGGARVVPGWQGGARRHSQYCECLCKPSPIGEIRAAEEKLSLHGFHAVEPIDIRRAGRPAAGAPKRGTSPRPAERSS